MSGAARCRLARRLPGLPLAELRERAGGLREEGHAPRRIYTIHGSGLVTPGHLAKLRATARHGPAAGAASREATEAYHRLDFWVGAWEVGSGGRKVGENRIRKIEGGCALIEHWRSARGGTGTSLFYVAPSEGVWKQVWVTPGIHAAAGRRQGRRNE